MKKTTICSLMLAGVFAFVMPQQTSAKHKPFTSKVTLKSNNHMHKAPSADAELEAKSFGLLDGPDGLTWYFTQENTVDGYNYSESVVTVYNAKHEKQGSFTVTVPEDIRVNQIEPYGLVTSKLFDLNGSTKEVVVYLHQVGNAENNYKGKDHLYIYSIGGDKVAEFDGDGMVVDASPNEWTNWQRLIVSHDDEDGVNTDIEFFRNPSWGDTTAVLEKTIQVPKNNITYTDGAFVNFFNVGGKPYTVICHYEKPFVEYDEDGNQMMDMETFMPFFTEDNNFVLNTYDKSYNLVSSFKVPTNVPSEQYIVRMNSFGVLSDNDLSNGYFSGDDKLNYIVMNEDVTMTTEYVLSFDVYDQDGNKIKTLAENVGDNYKRMTDIKGKEEQWMFLDADGESLFTVDLPSCTRRELPAKIDQYSISFNLDRVPADNAAGVQYIMGVNEATTDATGRNVIAMFAYLDENFKSDHYVKINLGPLAQTFTPLVNEEGLDPYLFNTDDKREFLFFSKVRDGEEGTDGHNVLFIANEDGDILETFNLEPGNEKGDIWTAMIMNYGTDTPSLFVNYYDWDNDNNALTFYDLPITKFAAGGDGTADSPFLISSVGDLQQIVKAPGAAYRIAQDFDAHGRSVAIEEFTGTLDGNGKTISNLDVTSDNYYGGLFGNTAGAIIKDITLNNPTATVTAKNEQFGLLSGFAIGTTVSNVCVKHGTIDGTASAATPLGTIVGMATAETMVSDCYVRDMTLNTNSRTVGGVVGEMRTSSTITNTAVNTTSITARGELGGITAIVGNGCTVSDCSVSDVTLKGNNFIGGVAGRCGVSAARGNIERCIVSAVIDCPSLSNDVEDIAKYAVGGITGYIEPDWQKEGTGNISGNVLYECRMKTFTNNQCEPPYMRIAGATINDEDETRTETCLTNNYQKAFELDGGPWAEGYDDDSSVYGKLLPCNETPALDFWTGIGYVFGTTQAEPWVYVTGKNDGNRPYLYFERNADPTAIEAVATSKPQTNAHEGIYTLEGIRISNITKPGLYIINGKKVMVK